MLGVDIESLSAMANHWKPFDVLTNQVVVTGGYLGNEKWVVTPCVVEDRQFVTLKPKDRDFTRAVGLDVSQKNPWSGNGILEYLASLRDKRIDELIIAHKLANDPRAARGKATTVSPVKINNRTKSYDNAQIPAIISFEHSAFQASDGTEVPAQTISCLSTSIKGSHLQIELTENCLEWLCFAIQSLDVASKRSLKRKELAEAGPGMRPALLSKIVRWRFPEDDKWTMYVRYRDESGVMKPHAVTVKPTQNEELNLAMVRQTEAEMEEYYYKNNHDKQAESGTKSSESGSPSNHATALVVDAMGESEAPSESPEKGPEHAQLC